MGHIGGGGFALGAGDAHQGEGIGGPVIEPLGRQALGLAHIADDEGGERAARLLFLGHIAHGAGLPGFEKVLGFEAVALADKQVTGGNCAGVIAETQELHIPAGAGTQKAGGVENGLQRIGVLHKRNLLFHTGLSGKLDLPVREIVKRVGE